MFGTVRPSNYPRSFMDGVVGLVTRDISWREVSGQIVILDLARSDFLELNRTGTRLWMAMIDGPTTADDLADLLVSVYGIAVEDARRDVKTFLAALDEANLLDRS